MSQTLSIVIPCFNEKNNILAVLKKVSEVKLIHGIQKEIIIVDDRSTDGTREVLRGLDSSDYNVHFLDKNYGKWYATRKGFDLATGDYVIVQDADLEYNPEDYNLMLEALIDRHLPVVYGSRRMKSSNQQYTGRMYYLGGNLLTRLINILRRVKMTDSYTCYKLFRRNAIADFAMTSKRFEGDMEITCLFLKKFGTITEVPINYYPRKNTEGKKINFYDFFQGVDDLMRLRFGLKKQPRTTMKFAASIMIGLLLFSAVVGFTMTMGRYTIHAYRSIAGAFMIAHFFVYRYVRFFFFSLERASIPTLIRDYVRNILELLVLYFGFVFYFVKIAESDPLFQGLFFMGMSLFIIGGWQFFVQKISHLQDS